MTRRKPSFKQFTSSGHRKQIINTALPPGTIVAFAGASAPSGWLICDGSQQQVATYPALNAAIGTNFGQRTDGSGGAGSTHFQLPDLRGRLPIGVGTGSGLTARALGATGGTETHTLTGAESGFAQHSHPISESEHGTSSGHHTLSSSSHSHSVEYAFVGSSGTGTTVSQVGGGNAGYFSGGPVNDNQSWSVGSSTVGLKDSNNVANQTNTKESSATSSHSNLMPLVVTNYIIKT